VTPFVKDFPISPQRKEEYILDRLIKPYALPVPVIDQQLAGRLHALEEKIAAPAEPAIEALQPEESYEPVTFHHKKKRVDF